MRDILAELKKCSLIDTYTATLLSMMEEDVNVLQLEADVGGVYAERESFRKFPERSLDVGIMEANLVGFACGLSINGKIPFIHAFSVFLARRAADQLFVSGCYNRANVKLFGSKPGVMGQSDGSTHQAFEDMSIVRAMPKMEIFDVADPVLLKYLMRTFKDRYGMAYVRIVRNDAYGYYTEDETFEIGKAKQLREGNDVTIIASGLEVAQALAAHEILLDKGIRARVLDCFSIKPIDKDSIIRAANETGCIVTAENHSVYGGLGSAVAEVLGENAPVPMRSIGVQDRFGQSGTLDYLMKEYRLLGSDIAEACLDVIRKKEKN